MAGEADGYYNNSQQGQPNYAMQQPQGMNGQQYGAPPAPPPDQQYNQPPPNYGQKYGNGGEKPTFDQAFKIERPRWNDLWAGILFLLVCAGFVAISGLSIQGYGMFAVFRDCAWWNAL